jgi:hypothetical protein
MQLALIADIHGNLFALDAVLNDLRQRSIEQILCLGDVACGVGRHLCCTAWRDSGRWPYPLQMFRCYRERLVLNPGSVGMAMDRSFPLEIIGNNYLVMGTLDPPEWKQGLRNQLSPQKMIEHLHDFKEVLTFKPVYY